MYSDLKTAMERTNEKRIVFEYPENDLEETKVIAPIKEPKKVVEKPEEKLEEEVNREEKSKNKLPIILAAVLLVILIALSIIYLVISNHDVKEVKVPDVEGLTTEEAIKELKKYGLAYTTKSEENEEIEEGKVIRTEPKKGSTKVKGSTVTIIESIGKEFLVLEDYTGQNYYEIKGKLEAKGIKIEMKTKSVENASEYKDKEDLIIDQEPKYNKDEEKKLYKNDTVILYIPEVDVYPDMVAEKWTLQQAQDFAKEYKLTLDIKYEETKDVEENLILSQSRVKGDPIYEGYTLKITVSKKLEDKKLEDKKDNTEALLPSDNE